MQQPCSARQKDEVATTLSKIVSEGSTQDNQSMPSMARNLARDSNKKETSSVLNKNQSMGGMMTQGIARKFVGGLTSTHMGLWFQGHPMTMVPPMELASSSTLQPMLPSEQLKAKTLLTPAVLLEEEDIKLMKHRELHRCLEAWGLKKPNTKGKRCEELLAHVRKEKLKANQT